MFDGKYSVRSIKRVFVVLITFFVVFFSLQTTFAETYFSKNFEWDYEGTQWTWSLSIPQSLYNAYKCVSFSDRTKYGLAGYGFLVTTQDQYVTQVANKLHEVATKKGYGAYDEVSFILAFVQSLPYTSDSVTTEYDEYPRFPIETLVDGGGDCEDTSILFATIVLILNYDAIFISPSQADHVAVGVWGKNLYGSYYEYHDKQYYYCETTAENWKIGDVPNEYQNVSARLYSINQQKQYVPSQETPPVPDKGKEPESLYQPRLEWLAIVLIAVGLSIVIIIGAYLIFKFTKVHPVEEIVPEPPEVQLCGRA